MGFFDDLNPEKYDRQYKDRDLVKRIAAQFKPYRKGMILISLLTLIMSLIGALLPIVGGRALDFLDDTSSWLVLIAIPGIVTLVGVSEWGLNWVRRSLTVRVLGDVVLDLRTRAFRAAAGHDLSFYDQHSSGRIVSRINSDTNDLSQLVTIVTDVASQVVQAIALGVVLVNTEWRLSLVLFAFMPVVFGIAIGFRRLARAVSKKGMQAMADVNAAIKETVSGIAIAKNFRQEMSIFEEFDSANRRSYRFNIQRGFVLSLIFPVLNATTGIFTAILVYMGGASAAAAVITAGAWYLFLLSLDRFLWPVMNLSAFWAQIQSGLSASERVFALIDAEPVVIQTDSRPVAALKGGVRFEKVTFRYTDTEPILTDFSLELHPGENLAFVGHTGSGKTSIARLIARFYEFQEGRILIDGMDIRSLDLGSYRRRLGIVSQVPFLFSGTVADNIRYAAPGTSEAEMLAMARRIGEGDWLETLPARLDTEVGERGAMLSMGQRQLVALMRVLVQKPAIFILDEATASIDPFTEWQIQQALNLILSESTSLLIAHRLSTVKAADRIIVIEKGKIIEQGDHDGLLLKGGHYATLYNTYFRHQSLAYVEKARELVDGD
ncbi:MAG: ABC transporter ATP-binding protein [Anaerolineales bacterium]|nr:ABC transporter ATP-binding protein [Anaerolineales bacterium]